MASSRFHLITDWTLAAPVEPVWQALMAPEQWLSWWRAVARVETLSPGGAASPGAPPCRIR
jgi:uncharacterized protein YndB with AHSA1/START domain